MDMVKGDSIKYHRQRKWSYKNSGKKLPVPHNAYNENPIYETKKEDSSTSGRQTRGRHKRRRHR